MYVTGKQKYSQFMVMGDERVLLFWNDGKWSTSLPLPCRGDDDGNSTLLPLLCRDAGRPLPLPLPFRDVKPLPLPFRDEGKGSTVLVLSLLCCLLMCRFRLLRLYVWLWLGCEVWPLMISACLLASGGGDGHWNSAGGSMTRVSVKEQKISFNP